jgi:hypothetical protein
MKIPALAEALQALLEYSREMSSKTHEPFWQGRAAAYADALEMVRSLE